MITKDMLVAMQGMIPSAVVTCNMEGLPNCTYISQVYYVDETHVALSHQFFNKTIRNISENPFACISIISPEDFGMWKMDAEYERAETEGETFEEMATQLEAIASMTGMSDVFKLQSARIFKITAVEKITI